MATFRFHLFLAVFAVAFAGYAQEAKDNCTVWSALVLGTNEEKPLAPSSDIAPFYPRLKSVFGYNQFRMVGQHTEMMDNPEEHWLIPSRNFCFLVKSKRAAKAGNLLNFELFQKNKRLAVFDLSCRRQAPLFIRGPQCGNGQLVLVVMVK